MSPLRHSAGDEYVDELLFCTVAGGGTRIGELWLPLFAVGVTEERMVHSKAG